MCGSNGIYFNSSGVWVRPRAEGETEMQYQVKNWYYFNWLSGGQVVEQHVHLLDFANWIMKEQTPVRANGMGGLQCRSGPEYGEIFDHHSIEFDYADGSKLISFCRHQKGCWMNVSRHALGMKGQMDTERAGTVLRVDGAEPRMFPRDTQDTHQTEHDHLFEALLAGKSCNEGDYGVSQYIHRPDGAYGNPFRQDRDVGRRGQLRIGPFSRRLHVEQHSPTPSRTKTGIIPFPCLA